MEWYYIESYEKTQDYFQKYGRRFLSWAKSRAVGCGESASVGRLSGGGGAIWFPMPRGGESWQLGGMCSWGEPSAHTLSAASLAKLRCCCSSHTVM